MELVVVALEIIALRNETKPKSETSSVILEVMLQRMEDTRNC